MPDFGRPSPTQTMSRLSPELEADMRELARRRAKDTQKRVILWRLVRIVGMLWTGFTLLGATFINGIPWPVGFTLGWGGFLLLLACAAYVFYLAVADDIDNS